jgi:hypothetical protein
LQVLLHPDQVGLDLAVLVLTHGGCALDELGQLLQDGEVRQAVVSVGHG